MAFKMAGFSAFTKNGDDDKKKTASTIHGQEITKDGKGNYKIGTDYKVSGVGKVITDPKGILSKHTKDGFIQDRDFTYTTKGDTTSITGIKSPLNKNGKYKKTKKKILSSTNIPTKEEPEGIPTEYTTGSPTEVYRKGFKKYVAETDLEHEPTGKFQQITRKGKKQLKKEGSYVSGRKYKKIKDDYVSGKLQEKNVNKRRLKEVKSSIKDNKKERVKKIGDKKAQANLKSSIAGLKEKKKELKNK
jgi:hypothetical protein